MKQALRSRNSASTAEEVQKVVRGSEQRQIFAPRQRYEGKITSSSPNQRWAADLIHMTAQPSPPYTHILIVQDIFTRNVYARALQSSTPQEVTAAFRNILASAPSSPKMLTTDKGIEFTKTPFPKLMSDRDISHQLKDPQDRNAIATLDRAIQSITLALASEKSKWGQTLQMVVSG